MKEKTKNWLRQFKFCFVWKRKYSPYPLDNTAKNPAKFDKSFPLNKWWPDMNWGNWSPDNKAVQLPENIIYHPNSGVSLITRRQNCKGYVWKTALDGSHYKKWTDGFKFSGACLKSKALYGFGRYLWNVKMPSYIGAWTALWGYEGENPTSKITAVTEKESTTVNVKSISGWYEEFDFELFCKSWYKATQISPGIYKGESHATAAHNNSSLRCIFPAKRFYWYEIDWQPEYISFYINGILVFHSTENIPQHKLAIIVSHGIGQYKKMKPTKDFEMGEVLGEMIIKKFIHIPNK